MRLSGVMRFDALTKTGVQLLQEFERQELRGITFTFGPLHGQAIMHWDASASLADISDLLELIGSKVSK